MFTVTKSYRDLPAAHRQPNHDGHCKLLHGHNWSFDIVFSCDALDKNGFVIDVGKLGVVRDFLLASFDHTLLLNGGDQDIPVGSETEAWLIPFAKVVRVPNCGMEGLAEWVFCRVTELIPSLTDDPDPAANHRGLRVISVTCWEDSKNRAEFIP